MGKLTMAPPSTGISSGMHWRANLNRCRRGPAHAYQAVVGQAVYLPYGTSYAQINLSNLIAGHDYALQVWVNQSDPGNMTSFSTAGGPSVALTPEGNAVNGLGQYVVGSFQANATGQQINFGSSAYPILNALQLRDMTGAGAGPPTASGA